MSSEIKQRKKHHEYYHVTHYKNLDSMRLHGIIPQVGDRSKKNGCNQIAVYLFNNIKDAKESITKWLNSKHVNKYTSRNQFAIVCIRIPPHKAKNLTHDEKYDDKHDESKWRESQYHGVIKPEWMDIHSII